MDYTALTLTQLAAAALSIGKGVVMRADEWDGVTDLTLTYLADTQGDIVFNAQENIRGLRLPEWSPGYVRAYVKGADPILTAPFILATPALRTLLSPTGVDVIGTDAKQDMAYHTLVIFPQELFANANTNTFDGKIRYTTAGGWLKSAEATGDPDNFVALTADEQRLLDLSIWMWKGYFERPPYTYRGNSVEDDEPVDVDEVTFRVVRPTSTNAMVTLGSPASHGIVIDVP